MSWHVMCMTWVYMPRPPSGVKSCACHFVPHDMDSHVIPRPKIEHALVMSLRRHFPKNDVVMTCMLFACNIGPNWPQNWACSADVITKTFSQKWHRHGMSCHAPNLSMHCWWHYEDISPKMTSSVHVICLSYWQLSSLCYEHVRDMSFPCTWARIVHVFWFALVHAMSLLKVIWHAQKGAWHAPKM